MKLSVSLVASLLILSTSVSAKVIDVQDEASCISACLKIDGDLVESILIDEDTLRRLLKDAEAFPVCQEVLADSQDRLNDLVSQLNSSRRDKYQLDLDNWNLQKRIAELENPPWYKDKIVWGSVGFSAGVAAVLISLALGGAL